MSVVLFNADLLKVIVKEGAKKVVWADEIIGDTYKNANSFTQQSKDLKLEPLIIDSFTASGLTKVLDAVKPHVREKLVERINANRGEFANFVDRAWKCLK